MKICCHHCYKCYIQTHEGLWILPSMLSTLTGELPSQYVCLTIYLLCIISFLHLKALLKSCPCKVHSYIHILFSNLTLLLQLLKKTYCTPGAIVKLFCQATVAVINAGCLLCPCTVCGSIWDTELLTLNVATNKGSLLKMTSSDIHVASSMLLYEKRNLLHGWIGNHKQLHPSN